MSDETRCTFCSRPARWHFGTEGWQVPTGYVMGRFTVAGETLHTCGNCGLQLRRWADRQADREARRMVGGAS